MRVYPSGSSPAFASAHARPSIGDPCRRVASASFASECTFPRALPSGAAPGRHASLVLADEFLQHFLSGNALGCLKNFPVSDTPASRAVCAPPLPEPPLSPAAGERPRPPWLTYCRRHEATSPVLSLRPVPYVFVRCAMPDASLHQPFAAHTALTSPTFVALASRAPVRGELAGCAHGAWPQAMVAIHVRLSPCSTGRMQICVNIEKRVPKCVVFRSPLLRRMFYKRCCAHVRPNVRHEHFNKQSGNINRSATIQTAFVFEVTNLMFLSQPI